MEVASIEAPVRLLVVADVERHVCVDKVAEEEHELRRDGVVQGEVVSEKVEAVDGAAVVGPAVGEVGDGAGGGEEAEAAGGVEAGVGGGAEGDGRGRRWQDGAVRGGQDIYRL